MMIPGLSLHAVNMLHVPLIIVHFCSILVQPATLAGFKTEPKFMPEVINVEKITNDRSRLAPGYIFIDPFVKNYGMGPQIYTIDGELVWYGNETAEYRVQDFKTCDFLGEHGNHLCWHEARERKGHNPYGRKVVFDNTYTQVGHNYTTAGPGSYPNTHEFRMLPGGERFLETVYEPRNMDLRPYAGPMDGWVFDGCFMEIDTRTADELYKWCYMDYLPVWETQVFLVGDKQTNTSSTGVGRGTYNSPWDFIHLNAIDKNSEGDYLVSSRYFDQIFKIAGPDNAHGLAPGSILWRLGGTGNDFEKDFTFSKQHAVRFVSTEDTGTVLSLFSNHWDGHTSRTDTHSEGQLIRVSNQTDNMSASLIQRFPHPHNKTSGAQGSLNILENGNAFVGWGTRHEVTEFSSTAEVLYHASFERYSYRAVKSQWVGKPHWNPKLLAYTKQCQLSEVHAYVSWNGATEVKDWRFCISTSDRGPWIQAGTFPKDGFETHVRLPSQEKTSRNSHSPFTRYVSAQALDAEGHVIGSIIAPTYVPCTQTIVDHNCTSQACQEPLDFEYVVSDSCAHKCRMPWLPKVAAAVILCIVIEVLDAMYLKAYVWSAHITPASPPEAVSEAKQLLEAGAP